MAGVVTAIYDHPVRSRLYILTLLSLIALLSSYDRYLVAILVEDIKRDLGASDAQMGMLTGFGFACVYSLLAIPVSRMSDGGRRTAVLSLSVGFWCIMTALCGLASNFAMLLLARLGVAAGEAGSVPTVQALVADFFPGRWRSTALSITVVMAGAGFTLANGGGGWIAEHWNWRAAFMAGAAPGPLLAGLLWLTVREPAPTASPHVATTRPMGSLAATAHLLQVPTFRHLCLGYALTSIGTYACIAWMPAFLMRRFAMGAGQVGMSYGIVSGSAMIFALLAGGLLADFLARRDRRWPLWQIALSFGAAFPLTIASLFVDELNAAMALAIPMTIAIFGCGSVAYNLVMELSGPHLRATGSALFLLFVNLFGMGLGPSLVGWLSDLLGSGTGAASLQYSLAMASSTFIGGGILIALGSRTVRRDIASAHLRGIKHLS